MNITLTKVKEMLNAIKEDTASGEYQILKMWIEDKTKLEGEIKRLVRELKKLKGENQNEHK